MLGNNDSRDQAGLELFQVAIEVGHGSHLDHKEIVATGV